MTKFYKAIGLFLLCFLFATCEFRKQRTYKIAERDTTITRENAYSDLFLDTGNLTTFIEEREMHDSLANRMRSFYNKRNYQFAWFFPQGMAEYVSTFLHMQDQFIYYSNDSTLYLPGLKERVFTLIDLQQIDPNDPQIYETELLLTYQFFRYAYYAYSGDRQVNLQDLDWFIPRKKLELEPFLDSLIAHQGERIEEFEPVHPQYNLLKKYLLQYYDIHEHREWPTLKPGKQVLRLGDKDPVVPWVRKRLKLLGYLLDGEADSLDMVTPLLAKEVISFQKHYGLEEDGSLGPTFFAEINTTPKDRIRQLLINMERIRWMPDHLNSDFILVNIPEYRLHVYEKGQHAYRMNVVVGAVAHRTVVFSDVVSQIVFSPYWNVPPSIVRNEILPALEKDSAYLDRNNMEWVGTTLRQKPGPGNALGKVKFLFPNNYNIYLHDTPSKKLFESPHRAFSHGCIRIAEPQKLAEFILRKDSTWTKERIIEAMNAGIERVVRLRPEYRIPVVIGYFTAWVDSEGSLNFRRDIYGHDKRMAARFLKNEK